MAGFLMGFTASGWIGGVGFYFLFFLVMVAGGA